MAPATATASSTGHKSDQLGKYTLYLALLILFAGWLLVFAYSVWRTYEDTLAQASSTSASLARSAEEHLTQSLRLIDMQASLEELLDHRQEEHDGKLTRQLAVTVQATPFLRSLSIANDNGVLLASTNNKNIGHQLALDDFFPAGQAARSLRLGGLWQGHDFNDGRPLTDPSSSNNEEPSFVPVLIRLSGTGVHRWLVFTLNPDYFTRHATQLLQRTEGTVQWYRYDGLLLFSTAPEREQAATQMAGTAMFSDNNAEAHGSVALRLSDGTEFIGSHRTSADFPARVVVLLDRSAWLEPWLNATQQRALITLPILAALSMALCLAWQRQRALERRQQALIKEQNLAASVFQISRDAIFITDSRARILSVNRAFEDLTGYSSQAVIGKAADLLIAPEVRTDVVQRLTDGLNREGHWQEELPCITRTGRAFTGLITLNTVRNARGGLQLATCTVVDVTDQRAQQNRLHLAASVFSHAREGILITDPNAIVVDVNDAFTDITGYARSEIIGQHTRLLNSGRQSKEFYQQLWGTLLTDGHWSGEMWNRRKSGEVYAQVSTISAVRDANEQVVHYVALISDISQQKENERRLQHIAHYDALTGLPNRVLLGDRLRQAMAQTLRRENKLALVFLDLDGFKRVNDAHGHDVGDKLLICLAGRMKQALREGDTLARLGGDEFVALLLDLPDHEASLPVLDRLRLAAAQPIQCEGLTLQVSASLGVTFYPQRESDEPDQLLRQADQAMYQAKLTGKNRFHVFDAEQDHDIRGRNENLEDIRLGLQAQQFCLHYQPKVNMRTGQVLGAEALIRWQHPVHGLLAPAHFLPVVQGHPLAVELGYWVMETALTQIETWHSLGLNVPISINVDAQLLLQRDFLGNLQAHLARHPGVHPGELELEVLETSALDDMDRVAQVIEACREMGVGFALDDFGTGYSSLTYLRHLPTSLLKIDQSFVRDMLDDPDDLAILDGVIGLAVAFRRDVIAEGVESVEHGQLLLRLGCDWAQGYGIARPMPAEDWPQWQRDWRPPPSWQSTLRTKREDLPLLFAAVEHRAWVLGVVKYLQGKREAPPRLNPHECRLGRWIDTHGHKYRHVAKLQFSELEEMHLDVHRSASQMIDDLPNHPNDADWVEQCVKELLATRDALFRQLTSWH